MRKLTAAAALGLALLFHACGPKEAAPAPRYLLATYGFSAASPLEARFKAPPEDVLEYFRREDGRPDYAAYLPSPAERGLVLEYLALLPPVYGEVFKARCAGIFFVKGFTGNGVTDWIIGPDGVYFYVLLNPDAFSRDLSATLTERERSCFKPAAGWELEVEAGHKYRGLLYALAHEAAHGLDYAAGVSPYTDEGMPARYRPAKGLADGFFRETWESYSVPRPAHDFPGRDRITFYGLGGGPKLDVSEAPELYGGLGRSGFASLYGARTWAEDLAELETFRTIAHDLGQPYRITARRGASVYSLRPMDGPAAARSAALRRAVERVRLRP